MIRNNVRLRGQKMWHTLACRRRLVHPECQFREPANFSSGRGPGASVSRGATAIAKHSRDGGVDGGGVKKHTMEQAPLSQERCGVEWRAWRKVRTIIPSLGDRFYAVRGIGRRVVDPRVFHDANALGNVLGSDAEGNPRDDAAKAGINAGEDIGEVCRGNRGSVRKAGPRG